MKHLCITICILYSVNHKILAQNRPFGTVGLSVNHESHQFNVDYGPPSTKGVHGDKNINLGIIGKYNAELFNNVYGYVGLGISQRISKIRRIYNKEFWDDYTTILNYTKKTKYNLLQLPIGIDFKFRESKKLDVLFGTSINVNFTYMQKYGEPDEEMNHIFRFYFFGYSNNISVTFLNHLSKNRLIEIRAFVTTYETWRKDEILFEDQKLYHYLNFNSFGISLAYGINL